MISRRLWRRIVTRQPGPLPEQRYLGHLRAASTDELGDDSTFRYAACVIFGAGGVFLPLVSQPSVLGVLVALGLYLPLSLIALISLTFSWYVLLGVFFGFAAALRVSYRVAALSKTGLMRSLAVTPPGREGVLMTIISRALLAQHDGANLLAHQENHTTLIVSLAGLLVFMLALTEYNQSERVTSSVALGLVLLGLGLFTLLYLSFRQEIVLGAVAGLTGGTLLRGALTPRIGAAITFISVLMAGWVGYAAAVYGLGVWVPLPAAFSPLEGSIALIMASSGLTLAVREVAIALLWRRVRRYEAD